MWCDMLILSLCVLDPPGAGVKVEKLGGLKCPMPSCFESYNQGGLFLLALCM